MSPSVKIGLPVWVALFLPIEVTVVTVCVYLSVAVLRALSYTLPSLSRPTEVVRETVTPLAVPVNPGSDTKVTFPVSSSK